VLSGAKRTVDGLLPPHRISGKGNRQSHSRLDRSMVVAVIRREGATVHTRGRTSSGANPRSRSRTRSFGFAPRSSPRQSDVMIIAGTLTNKMAPSSDGRARAQLPAHPVKGIAKAMLSRMTNVKAGRHEGAAFTRLIIDGALRTRWKVLNFEGRRCLLSHHSPKEKRQDNEARSHIFPHSFDGQSRRPGWWAPPARPAGWLVAPPDTLRACARGSRDDSRVLSDYGML
jgi:hypothetical protein